MTDMTLHDTFNVDDAAELLRDISKRYERAGDYSTAGQLLNAAQWMEDADERITELEDEASDHWFAGMAIGEAEVVGTRSWDDVKSELLADDNAQRARDVNAELKG